jgi:hypothetical protein
MHHIISQGFKYQGVFSGFQFQVIISFGIAGSSGVGSFIINGCKRNRGILTSPGYPGKSLHCNTIGTEEKKAIGQAWDFGMLNM